MSQEIIVKNEKILNVLEAARKLISDPKTWIKGITAADAEGEAIEYCSEYACKFCTVGAIYRAANNEALADAALEFFKTTVPYGRVILLMTIMNTQKL